MQCDDFICNDEAKWYCQRMPMTKCHGTAVQEVNVVLCDSCAMREFFFCKMDDDPRPTWTSPKDFSMSRYKASPINSVFVERETDVVPGEIL